MAARREITDPQERAQLLALTALDIQVASVGDNETGFFAAHGMSDSVLALQDRGELSVWVIVGPEEDRRAAAQNIRSSLERYK